ncbi:HEPN domain-containing protein [Leptospira congkakensis]|uniref:HEPN domain-containing protein n=1 Tax=Leptospira congkakensis TaxID=2484932 RepID=A0A4Z1A205_9LEPT|nr:HEPN domain-containing protein [Leptospira congkakensis]TGL87538.1 HEPN domain-containing protein [Leptospira congkakensis]TGL89847.1 HEPN domain-containing protein [Leptospira congkakensis]TGL95688.1 HEPN domain-containing protein [Leptospira congkakensis]
MQHDDPGSPEAWLVHAKSDLLLAKLGDRNDILLNQLCFHAQQTAEKSLKAVLIKENAVFLFTHNIKTLILSLPDRIEKPSFFDELAILTDYAVSTRYPGDYEEILEAEYVKAIELAELVFKWANHLIKN